MIALSTRMRQHNMLGAGYYMHSLFGAVRMSHRFETKQLKRFSFVCIMHETNAFGSVYISLPLIGSIPLSHTRIQSNQ